MSFEAILVLTIFSILFVGGCLAAYYGSTGVRAYARRKSWCKKMGYKLVKERLSYGSFVFKGKDSQGALHEIPDEIYPHNLIVTI